MAGWDGTTRLVFRRKPAEDKLPLARTVIGVLVCGHLILIAVGVSVRTPMEAAARGVGEARGEKHLVTPNVTYY